MKTNVQLSPLVHVATATEAMEFVPTQVIAVVNGVGAEPRQIIVSRHQLQRQVTLTQAHLRLLPTVLMLDSVLLVRWEMTSVLANLSVAQTGGTAEKANSTASRQRFGTEILLVKTRTMMERVVVSHLVFLGCQYQFLAELELTKVCFPLITRRWCGRRQMPRRVMLLNLWILR